MEQTLTDSLGNTITLSYDAAFDKVSVKNSAVDNDFHEVRRESQYNPELVLEIENNVGDDSWNTYSDEETRSMIHLFWITNKVNQN